MIAPLKNPVYTPVCLGFDAILTSKRSHNMGCSFVFLGIPVLIIVLYIVITQLAIEWSFTEAYADVHSNGDM